MQINMQAQKSGSLSQLDIELNLIFKTTFFFSNQFQPENKLKISNYALSGQLNIYRRYLGFYQSYSDLNEAL